MVRFVNVQAGSDRILGNPLQIRQGVSIAVQSVTGTKENLERHKEGSMDPTPPSLAFDKFFFAVAPIIDAARYFLQD